MSRRLESLEDGHYTGFIKSVEKKESEKYTLYIITFQLEFLDDEFIEHSIFVTQKNVYFIYEQVLIPLGLYASDVGFDDLCKIDNMYVEFDKSTTYYNNKQYPTVVFNPVFEIENNKPVGASNDLLDLNALFLESDDIGINDNTNKVTESNSEPFDDDDDENIPF